MLNDLTGKQISAIKIFSISIKYLKDQMIKEINSQLAIGEILVKDIDFILTVPANWGEEAKTIMEKAAVEVGIRM